MLTNFINHLSMTLQPVGFPCKLRHASVIITDRCPNVSVYSNQEDVSGLITLDWDLTPGYYQ